MKIYQTTFAPQRRGMILLLTLALLTMFSLLIVSFMFATSNMRRAAEAYGRLTYEDMKTSGEYGSSGTLDSAMDKAVTTLLVGSKPDPNSPSVLVHQSLLESIYGHPVIGGKDDQFAGVFGAFGATGVYLGDNIIAVGLDIAHLLVPSPDLAGHSPMDIIGNVLTITNVDNSTAAFATSTQRNDFVDLLKNKSVRILMYCAEGTVLPPGLRDADFIDYSAAQNEDKIAGNDYRVRTGKSCFLINVKKFTSDNEIGKKSLVGISGAGSNKMADLAYLLDGCEYKINGAAFRGTGIGFDDDVLTTAPYTAQQTLGYTVGGDIIPYALAPNPQGIDSGNVRTFLRLLSGVSDEAGSTNPDDWTYYLTRMNVDYTAPDFNNIFLSWYNYADDGYLMGIIPSFHRPSIVNYWNEQGKIANALDLQRLVLRPLPLIHPEFTGSNPVLVQTTLPELPDLINILGRRPDELGASYDVDTDADGLNDAYWMDIGLPVEYDAKSKQSYKPLVAITVRELDSRINVNYHGNRKHEYNDAALYDDFKVSDDELIPTLGGKGENSIELFGEGAGPSEISLNAALPQIDFSSSGTTIAERIFGVSTNENQVGRYGIDKDASDNVIDSVPNAGVMELSNELRIPLEGYAIDGISTSLWSYDNAGGIERDAGLDSVNNGTVNPGNSPVAFSGRSPNLWGNKPQYVDILGNNVSLIPEIVWGENDDPYTVIFNNPYAIDYKSITDKLFDIRETETLFRLNDLDVKELLPRLFNVVAATLEPKDIDGNVSARDALRRLQEHITNSSYDVQSLPALIAPNATSIYSQVLKCVGGNEDEAAAFIAKFLPPEIMQGKKLDLNRLTREYGVTNPRDTDGKFNPDAYKEGLIARARFAEQLFYLLVVLSYDELYGSATPQIDAYDGGTVLKDAIPNDDERRQWMIARLAQWAVNFVDFTDPDDSMTPLLVPIDPFAITPTLPAAANWVSVPSLTTDMLSGETNATGAASTGSYFSRTVSLFWGMERPNLVISETMALHNRGTADTNAGQFINATAPATPDTTYDQVKAPEPSLFVELHNIGSGNRPDAGLVSFMDAARNVDGTKDYDHPMWRLVVGKREDEVKFTGGTTQDLKDDENLFYLLSDESTTDGNTNATTKKARFTHSLQPKQMVGETVNRSSVLGASQTTVREINIDRIIWLGKSTLEAGCSYYWKDFDVATAPNAASRVLAQNEYLTIGPYLETRIANPEGNFDKGQSDSPLPQTTPPTPACQMIRLDGTGMVRQGNQPWKQAIKKQGGGTWEPYVDGVEYKDVSTEYKTMKYAIMKDSSGVSGVNISGMLPSVPAYYNFTTPEDTPRDMDVDAPLTKDGIYGDGTVQCYKPLFLQRLADPLRAYDAVSNPYISVDYTMVDLTVYTGVEGKDATATVKKWNAEQKEFGTTPQALDFKNNIFFHSRQLQRAGGVIKILPDGNVANPNPAEGVLSVNPWGRNIEKLDMPLFGNNSIGDLVKKVGESSVLSGFTLGIDYGKTVTFGYLNYGAFNDGAGAGAGNTVYKYPIPKILDTSEVANKYHPLSSVVQGSTVDEMNNSIRPYIGAPWNGSNDRGNIDIDILKQKVHNFNTPTWNNAPLVSAYDSLNVPASAPGRFGLEYLQTQVGTTPIPGPSDIPKFYDASEASSLGFGNKKLPIPAHLLNFFVSATPDVVAPATDPSYKSLNLARLFDFAGLQSKFNGTVDVLHAPTDDPADTTNLTYATTYREPGKVNINMITPTEWTALTHNGGVTNKFFDDAKTNTFSGALHNNELEQFPFRAASTSFLRPMVMGTDPADPDDDDLLARAFLSDSTLLRPVYEDGFGGRHDKIPEVEAPLFARQKGFGSRDRYYPMSRLSEMTTPRSNVFAVWITIGRFAVSRKYEDFNDWTNPTDGYGDRNTTLVPDQYMFESLYPDGRMLQQEIGIDGKGEVIRRREFLIIDRTIPVGFRRGEKLNSDETIQLRRAL